jgi:DNA-directed RNA polymerase subunit RPC12/RpoP
MQLKQSGDRLWEKCHWCGDDIVWWQKIPVERIRNARQKDGRPSITRFVAFEDGGKVVNALVVTVDHVQELAKGGSNYHTNIVLACQPCNTKRSNPKLHLYPNCVQCGRAKSSGSRKRCADCNRSNQKRILKEKGLWERHVQFHKLRMEKKLIKSQLSQK